MRWAGHVERVGERGVYMVLMGKPEGQRPLALPRRRWDDDFELNLQEIRMLSVDRVDLAQGEDRRRALVNAMMKLRVSYKMWRIS
jgi:hypothetical protein